MKPLFNPGDRVLINRWSYLFSAPKPGDIIACQLLGNRSEILLKKVQKVTGDELFVMGINSKDSLNSRSFGPINRRQVLGKVLNKY